MYVCYQGGGSAGFRNERKIKDRHLSEGQALEIEP